MNRLSFLTACALWMAQRVRGADEVAFNRNVRTSNDTDEGPPIMGKELEQGPRDGVVNYVLLYSHGGRESKEEARKLAALYPRFEKKVHFVTVNMDRPRTRQQQQLVRDFYQGFVPHVVILGCDGTVLYDAAGPTDMTRLAKLLIEELKK